MLRGSVGWEGIPQTEPECHAKRAGISPYTQPFTKTKLKHNPSIVFVVL